MEKLKISFLEKSYFPKASRVLSEAMLKNPLHVAVFRGQGEKERLKIEKMFSALLNDIPALASWTYRCLALIPGKRCRDQTPEPILYEVDAYSASAYLETDTDKNIKFYQEFDFKVVDESDILGVSSRYMLRDPIH